MNKHWITSALLMSSLGLSQLHAQEDDCCCGPGERPMRFEVRHIEGRGVGYDQGYTTFAGFFSYVGNNWVPFLDGRVHVFNNARPAANGGLGLRYVGHRVWGINGYYDYRRDHHHSYNQGGFGLESLGVTWDFRANGYFPAGNTKGHHFDLDFDHFEGNRLILSRKQDFAMKGGNAEIGAHVNSICSGPLYFAAGPYYFKNEGKHAWGGEGRVQLDYSDYLRLELSGSYDHIFRGIAQGQLSLLFPFGTRSSVRRKGCDDCCRAGFINQRAVQRVDRNEIIVLDTHHTTTNAIDPRDNQPYTFVFVDNRSTRARGTFADPFANLTEAQNASAPGDIIYVFAGDHTSTGLDTGITLQDHQKLFGAGIDQHLDTTLGRITIPSQQPGFPVLTSPIPAIIRAANNNEIAGLRLNEPGASAEILFNYVTDGWIHDNIFDVVGSAQRGIELAGAGGQVKIQRNLFNQASDGTVATDAINLTVSVPGATYIIEENQFINLTPGIGQTNTLDLDVVDIRKLIIRNNLFQGSGDPTLSSNVEIALLGTAEVDISHNRFVQTAGDEGSLLLVIFSPANVDVDILNNVWINSVNPALPSLLASQGAGTPQPNSCITLIGNVSDAAGFAYEFANSGTGQMVVEGAVPNQNVGQVGELGNVTNGPCP